jgi:hypothetical protein
MDAKFWVALIFGLALLSAVFNGASNSSSNTSRPSSVNTDSFDYNYSKNRFKLEGYSDEDSRKAAEAIIKFQQAQERNR